MEEIVEVLIRHDAVIENLVSWQREQNGILTRLEEKVDGVNRSVGERLERLYLALLGLLGGVVASLLLQLWSLK